MLLANIIRVLCLILLFGDGNSKITSSSSSTRFTRNATFQEVKMIKRAIESMEGPKINKGLSQQGSHQEDGIFSFFGGVSHDPPSIVPKMSSYFRHSDKGGFHLLSFDLLKGNKPNIVDPQWKYPSQYLGSPNQLGIENVLLPASSYNSPNHEGENSPTQNAKPKNPYSLTIQESFSTLPFQISEGQSHSNGQPIFFSQNEEQDQKKPQNYNEPVFQLQPPRNNDEPSIMFQPPRNIYYNYNSQSQPVNPTTNSLSDNFQTTIEIDPLADLHQQNLADFFGSIDFQAESTSQPNPDTGHFELPSINHQHHQPQSQTDQQQPQLRQQLLEKQQPQQEIIDNSLPSLTVEASHQPILPFHFSSTSSASSHNKDPKQQMSDPHNSQKVVDQQLHELIFSTLKILTDPKYEDGGYPSLEFKPPPAEQRSHAHVPDSVGNKQQRVNHISPKFENELGTMLTQSSTTNEKYHPAPLNHKSQYFSEAKPIQPFIPSDYHQHIPNSNFNSDPQFSLQQQEEPVQRNQASSSGQQPLRNFLHGHEYIVQQSERPHEQTHFVPQSQSQTQLEINQSSTQAQQMFQRQSESTAGNEDQLFYSYRQALEHPPPTPIHQESSTIPPLQSSKQEYSFIQKYEQFISTGPPLKPQSTISSHQYSLHDLPAALSQHLADFEKQQQTLTPPQHTHRTNNRQPQPTQPTRPSINQQHSQSPNHKPASQALQNYITQQTPPPVQQQQLSNHYSTVTPAPLYFTQQQTEPPVQQFQLQRPTPNYQQIHIVSPDSSTEIYFPQQHQQPVSTTTSPAVNKYHPALQQQKKYNDHSLPNQQYQVQEQQHSISQINQFQDVFKEQHSHRQAQPAVLFSHITHPNMPILNINNDLQNPGFSNPGISNLNRNILPGPLQHRLLEKDLKPSSKQPYIKFHPSQQTMTNFYPRTFHSKHFSGTQLTYPKQEYSISPYLEPPPFLEQY